MHASRHNGSSPAQGRESLRRDTTGGCGQPIYPFVEVSMRSRRSLVLVSAVRWALKRAGVAPEQIARFSTQALNESSALGQRRICANWVTVAS